MVFADEGYLKMFEKFLLYRIFNSWNKSQKILSSLMKRYLKMFEKFILYRIFNSWNKSSCCHKQEKKGARFKLFQKNIYILSSLETRWQRGNISFICICHSLKTADPKILLPFIGRGRCYCPWRYWESRVGSGGSPGNSIVTAERSLCDKCSGWWHQKALRWSSGLR